jgi:putative phage-type endonuclease
MIDRELRRHAISSTDLGPIFGVSPFRDEFTLCVQKKGHLPEEEATPRMRMGRHLERGIAEAYAEITGRRVEWHNHTVRHATEEWMVATPDALVAGEKRGLDCKLVHWTEKREWGDTADQIPPMYQLQMIWMMAVLDYDVWDVAAYMGDGLPRIYEIERDARVERVVIRRAREWYDRYVIGDEVPPMGASPDAGRYLQQLFPTHKRPDIRIATDEEVELLARYSEVRAAEAEIKSKKSELENKLRLAVADKEGIELPGAYTFTWRRTKDSHTINYESMAIALKQKFLDERQRQELDEFYAVTTPGFRKIRFTDHTRAKEEEAA